MSFHFTSIAQYHSDLLAGSTTCTKATLHYLQQIEGHWHLNAFTAVWADEALAKAAALDALLQADTQLLPLHGVVVALKDVLNYSGHEVTAGSAMLKGYKALYTATAVQRLLDAGAIIIGNCNCDEFAMGSSNENSYYGPVKNAADPARVPGGSSGGSAVAVQAGLCMVSLGSDTGGSVRQPADFCGVTGLKPTYGSISRYGLIAYASSFDCIGIFGQHTADVAMVFETIAGHDQRDATSLPGSPESLNYTYRIPPDKLRFAYFDSTLSLPGLDPEIKTAHLELFDTLKAKGHIVEAVPFSLLDYVVPTYYVLTTAEASSNLSRYDGVRYGHQSKGSPENLTEFYKRNRSEGFGAEVKRRILLGSFVLSAGFYDAYFTKAQQVRQLLVQQTALVFSQFDAIIMPVSPTTAFALGEKQSDPVAMYLADIFTVFANLTGVPGLALPLFRHSNGLPFGTQVMTNRGKELLLHETGLILEQVMGKGSGH